MTHSLPEKIKVQRVHSIWEDIRNDNEAQLDVSSVRSMDAAGMQFLYFLILRCRQGLPGIHVEDLDTTVQSQLQKYGAL